MKGSYAMYFGTDALRNLALYRLLCALILQGGMGVGISTWILSRAVALYGRGRAAGTVSITMIAYIAWIRLQRKDPDQLRALVRFGEIFPGAERLIRNAFVYGNKVLPAYTLHPPPILRWMTIFGSFAEFWLASEGHDYPVGANALHEVGYPHLDELVGLMLAVALRKLGAASYLVMGAGLPSDMPGMMKSLVHDRYANFSHRVEGSKLNCIMHLDLVDLVKDLDEQSRASAIRPDLLRQPLFIPIVTMFTALQALGKGMGGFDDIDGLVVENKDAGGHNANPRNKTEYGPKDEMDFERLRATGLPFWCAGGWTTNLKGALDLGARGIQVGGPFSLTSQSGTKPWIIDMSIKRILDGTLSVTSSDASPTGYKFQLVENPGTVARTFQELKPGCTKCYLRYPVLVKDRRGRMRMEYMCTGDPLYEKRGGTKPADGKTCLCNRLTATAGLLTEKETHILPVQTGGTYLARDTLYVMNQTGTGRPGQPPMGAEHVIDAILSQL